MTDSDFEKQIYTMWNGLGIFDADEKSGKRPYSLLIPPPNLTGELHLGHAMQHSIMDAISRHRRLSGFDVLLLPGVDHAGIQFEASFDKQLARENFSKQKLGRDEWLKRAWKFKEEIYNSVSSTWRMMGLSADWRREVFTLDDKPRTAVFTFFKKLWDDGLIYKGPYIVQWCPKDNTAIEDVEMEYEERKEKLYYVKYQVSSIKYQEYITVATTRPETIFADTAVAIYPKHPKYKTFVDVKVINPLNAKAIPVIEDERVEKDFGTGALKVTPGHDHLDYEIGKDHQLEILQAIDKNGKLTDITGEFQDLKVTEAREKVVEKLEKIGALEKVEEYVHSVAVCERCKTVVEPLISEEWFVKVDGLAKGAIEVIKDDQIKFLPKNYNKILVEWLENIHDWCISRSLWWGHRIPVWYRENGKWKMENGKFDEDAVRVSLESPGPGWVQEEKVLDTWFSSGLWPLSTLGWPVKKMENGKWKMENSLDKYFPWDFEISAPEIKYLWIARMIMISVYLTDEVPFKTMFFHGMLRDLRGRKFSKSLGNGIEPTYLINNWGVDATRMALYTYAIPGRDGRVSKQILDERGKNFRNFGTKLRNIARFIYELKPKGTRSTKVTRSNEDDKKVLSELEKTAKKVTKYLENLELHLAVDELYSFIWHELADKYIESSKERRGEAQTTLEKVFETSLILLHPFMPFLTEDLYQKYIKREKSIMLEAWPSIS